MENIIDKLKKEQVGSVNNFISMLLHSDIQARVFHWQTYSHAVHLAMEAYYDDIGDLIDRLVESYQGHTVERIVNFTMEPLVNCEHDLSEYEFFTKLLKNVEVMRRVFKDCPDCDNIVQEITALVAQTIDRLSRT